MYSDDEERKGFPIRDFLLKLVLIIIFVLLLMWLLPTKNNKNVDVSPLTDRIFNANIQGMKEAAIPYFTTERLPKKVGDDVKLTLQQMLDLKLLLPFTDKNGDTCDTKNSYVLVTKEENEYLMKVYLKCNDDEDYILVHIGCYSYCTTENGICEKQEESTPPQSTKPKTGPSCVLEVTSGTKGSSNWYKTNAKVEFKSKNTTTAGAKIVSYGLSTSSAVVYNNNSSITISKDGNTKVYGFVKDSTGKTAVCTITIKKDEKTPECNLTILNGTKNAKGNYVGTVQVGFASKTDATSKIASYGLDTSSKANYNGKTKYALSKVGTTKVYGYVKDSAGHTKTCSISVTIDEAEKQISQPSCSLKVVSGTLGNNNWYTSNVVVGFASSSSTNGATIVNYGIGTTEKYDGSKNYTIDKDGTHVIKGYVKDSNGYTSTCSVTIKRDATKPSCSLSVSDGIKGADNTYTTNIVIGFKSKTDATSDINSYGIGVATTYAKNTSYTVTAAGTHTINGYVKDNAGNTNVCSLTVTKKNQTYEYQYSKPIPETYSSWTPWETKEYTCSAPPTFKNTNTYKVEDLGSKQVAYETVVPVEIVAKQIKETGKVSQKTCNGYTYYKSSQTSTKTYAIHTASEWKFVDYVTLNVVPMDTLATKYEYVGMNWNSCGNDCATTPHTIWKKYTREVSTLTATGAVITPTGATVKCDGYETKDTILFTSYENIVGYENVKQTNYKTVCTYQYSTRTITKDAYTDYKWSFYNNQSLLDDGYKMTGNRRLTN